MDSFSDEYSKAFFSKLHKQIWQEGADLLLSHHPEALFLDANRVGVDIETYTMFRNLMRESLVFLDNDILACTRQKNALQSIGSFDVQSKKTGEIARVSATCYLEFSGDKIIACIGFLDVASLVTVLDPVSDRQLLEFFSI